MAIGGMDVSELSRQELEAIAQEHIELRDRLEKLEQLVHSSPFIFNGSSPDDPVEKVKTIEIEGFSLGNKIIDAPSQSDIKWLEEQVEALKDGTHDQYTDQQPTTIQTYAAIPPEGRKSLDPTDRRATYLFEGFGSDQKWYDTASGGKKVISTRPNKHGKSKLLPLMRAATGNENLQWKQVHRAMKRVAQLSGGDVESHSDGAIVYKPDWNDPWSDGDRIVHVLILERPELLRGVINE